ncbi:MAG: hypothetical protein KAQ64_05130 [Candidatus Pacebacteria bacterium]|nr:hypothetical protein [Candidatus Paceibacterota bacterium]
MSIVDNVREGIEDSSSGIKVILETLEETAADLSKLEKYTGDKIELNIESLLLILMFVPAESISTRVFNQIEEIHNFLKSDGDYDLSSLEKTLEKEENEEFSSLKHCYLDDFFYLWHDLRMAEGCIVNPNVFCPDTEESDRITKANTLLDSADTERHSDRAQKEKQRIQTLSNKAWRTQGTELADLNQFEKK